MKLNISCYCSWFICCIGDGTGKQCIGNKYSTHVPWIPTAYFGACRSSVYFMHTENDFKHGRQCANLYISSFQIAICCTSVLNEAPHMSALPKQSSCQGCGVRISLSFLEPSSPTHHQKLNTLFHLSVSMMSDNLIASDSGSALPTWPRKTPVDIGCAKMAQAGTVDEPRNTAACDLSMSQTLQNCFGHFRLISAFIYTPPSGAHRAADPSG